MHGVAASLQICPVLRSAGASSNGRIVTCVSRFRATGRTYTSSYAKKAPTRPTPVVDLCYFDNTSCPDNNITATLD